MSSAGGLVGRGAELEVAAAAVTRLAEGRSSVLVIEGEAGIGKTCLVQSIIVADMLSLMQQLGVVPAGPPASS